MKKTDTVKVSNNNKAYKNIIKRHFENASYIKI